MFLTYGTAVKRAKRGYDFLWLRGHLYNLSLRKLRDNRGQLRVQSLDRCPLALAHTDRRYPGAQSDFHSAALMIAVMNRWSSRSRTLDRFVESHGFDLFPRSLFVPNWLHDRQWKLLDRAWKELLELPLPDDIDTPIFKDMIHPDYVEHATGERLI